MKISLQQFNPTYFVQLFAIYYNKFYEVIAYIYKIIEIVNCLLQQYIYHCIKVIIKIFRVYCNKNFCCINMLSQILLQHLVSTIAMTLMLLQWFFSLQ